MRIIQGGSNMTGTDLCVNKPHCVPVIFEPPCVKMGLMEIEWGCMAWIHLAQDRNQLLAPVNTVIKLRVPKNVGKFVSICATGGFSRRTQLHEVS
jgi:hypothetical protein